MIISVTERAEYKRCRRRWNLGSRNRLGLTKIVPSAPLALGTLIHDALGNWLEQPETSLVDFFMASASAAIDTAREVYVRQVGAPMSDVELTPLWESVTLGHAMLSNYQAYWKQPLPPKMRLVAQEQRIVLPIPGSEHTEEWVWDDEAGQAKLLKLPEPTPHFLEGRLDGIIADEHDRLYVLEHKTYSQRPREDVLKMNDQFIAYHWMLTQLGLGEAAGVAYDGLWKRAQPPTKVEGRKGELSDLFTRIRITRPPEEIMEFEYMLALEALEMGNNPPIYLNRTWDGSCTWCDYNSLCSAISRGEDVEYVLTTSFTNKQTDPSEQSV